MKNLVITAGFLLACWIGASKLLAQDLPSGDYYGPTNTPLDSWSFSDHANWTSDLGYAPVSFTNISYSNLGDANSDALVMDTNVPAWLQYNVVENDGTVNLSVANGSVAFWFAPGSWSSTNQGGVGPGEWGRLLEVGGYTPESSQGWWSILVDSGGNNLYFAAQTNDLSSNVTTYLSYPISWSTNYFHFIAITYSPSNTALYLDGLLATNGPGLTVYPGTNVLANGFWIGSGSNGMNQAHGLFNTVQTYDYPLDSNDVAALYNWYFPYYQINPFNTVAMNASAAFSFSAYGTNLALTPPAISNHLATVFVVNSTADILYEIQGTTNLANPNWTHRGFIYGSELTNWTACAGIAFSQTNNDFYRIRSWISSDGSGLPDWWELQYFGTTGVDPYGNPAGDGYSNLYKFQHGMNPNQFYTPAAPQGVMVNYSSSSGTANISWQPSPGNVTGYTVKDSDGNTINVSGTSSTLSVPYAPNLQWGSDGDPTIYKSYQIQAQYAGGNSALSASVPLQPATVSGSIVPAPNGNGNELLVGGIPANAVAVRVYMYNTGLYGDLQDFTVITNLNIPVSNFVNGTYTFPFDLRNVAQLPSLPYATWSWRFFYLQSVDAQGNVSGGSYLSGNWGPNNFYDGRVQLKQNLVFQFRVADSVSPFGLLYYVYDPNVGLELDLTYTAPGSYVYAGFYDINNTNGIYGVSGDWPSLNIYLPFEDNTLYRNFVYSPSDVDSNGDMTTGVNENFGDGTNMSLTLPLKYQPTTGVTGNTPLLDTNAACWLCTYPTMQWSGGDLMPNGFSISSTYDPVYNSDYEPLFTLDGNARNYWGLPWLAATAFYKDDNENSQNTVINAGDSLATWSPCDFYMETAQPQLQTVELS
jgi:hypothetical protein